MKLSESLFLKKTNQTNNLLHPPTKNKTKTPQNPPKQSISLLLKTKLKKSKCPIEEQ